MSSQVTAGGEVVREHDFQGRNGVFSAVFSFRLAEACEEGGSVFHLAKRPRRLPDLLSDEIIDDMRVVRGEIVFDSSETDEVSSFESPARGDEADSLK